MSFLFRLVIYLSFTSLARKIEDRMHCGETARREPAKSSEDRTLKCSLMSSFLNGKKTLKLPSSRTQPP